MNAAAVLAALRNKQMSLLLIIMLELTGWMFPPPAQLKDGDSFDYIIIGGGTAGSVIATRLVQKEYNVLLIEAGEDSPYESIIPALVPYLKNSTVDWNNTMEADGFSYQCHVNKITDLGIGKMLGGSGELNYMIYSRGNNINFEEWCKITNDSIWSWKNVLPYFIKSENVNDTAIRNSELKYLFGSKGYIGVTRDQTELTSEVLEGFKEAGKDLIDDIDGNRIGYSRGLLTINQGLRQGAGPRYLSHISESPYITTAKNTLATKIIFDRNNNAVAVELITDEGKKIVVESRKEIIVTAGAIKSPQLLMLSGIGPKKQLKKFNITTISDLPVGKNLQDHIATIIPYKTNKKIMKRAKDPGQYPAGVFVGYAALNNSKYGTKYPDYQVVGYIIDDMKFMLQFCASTHTFTEGICNKLHDDAENNQVIITLISNLYARSRGTVTLQSIDPNDPPKVVSDGFCSDRDLIDMVDYIHDYLKVEKTEAFKDLGVTRIDVTSPRCDVFMKGSREYWRCYILCMMVNLRSFAGTCAMGSVVDSRLRVRGVKRLRVADASVMPTIPTGATYNTVIMVAERASEIIMEDAGENYNSMSHEKIVFQIKSQRVDQIKNLPN